MIMRNPRGVPNAPTPLRNRLLTLTAAIYTSVEKPNIRKPRSGHSPLLDSPRLDCLVSTAEINFVGHHSTRLVVSFINRTLVTYMRLLELKTREMEARSELKQKIYEIFKEFMMRITKLEELDNAANTFLLRFHQALCLLKRSPMVTSSKLIENILKNNETKRLKSYIEAGCINIDEAARSTRALHTSLSGLSDHLIKAQSLLSELERLTDDAALAIETATTFSTQLDEESSDELPQVTSDEENETAPFPQEPQATEHATVIAVVNSMVKQNYVMQEMIVRSLSLKTSFDELDTYTMMWSLRPFVEDQIMKRAWKCIY